MTPLAIDLAQKLKDAGFPGSSEWTAAPDGNMSVYAEGIWDWAPDLDELIEACPRRYNGYHFNLWAYDSGKLELWIACYGPFDGQDPMALASMWDTRQEAVAHLWLKLNEKKNA